jgi:hypothetical protein
MEPVRALRSLRPRVSQEEAITAFGRGLGSVLRGPLQRVAAVYLPFRFFEVEVENRGRVTRSCYAADAVTGALDLFEFPAPPTEPEVVTLTAANCVPALVDEMRALELIVSKVERAVFLAGFFRVHNLHVRARRLPADVHVPYWLGFFGNGEQATLRVMDGVRRQMEGSKARALFEDWLMGRLTPVTVAATGPIVRGSS